LHHPSALGGEFDDSTKGDMHMDTSTLIRIGAGVLAVIVLAIIIMRRRGKQIE